MLNKKSYKVLKNKKDKLIASGRHTEILHHNNNQVKIKTCDVMKYSFLKELYKYHPDMKVSKNKITENKFDIFISTKGTPIELYSEYDEKFFEGYSCARMFDCLYKIDIEELNETSFVPETKTESIVWNAYYESTVCYFKALKKLKLRHRVDYVFLSLDIHSKQFILSKDNKKLICIDPINLVGVK